MKTKWRQSLLWTAGLAVGAIAIAAMPEPPSSGTAERVRVAEKPNRPRTPDSVRLDLARLNVVRSAAEKARHDTTGEIADIFLPKTWYVAPPPPPPPKVLPPPAPSAPPLPFSYIGRYDDPGKPPVVLLLWRDRLYAVSAGDSIDDTYRIERVESGWMELTYLPLQQRQVLQIGTTG